MKKQPLILFFILSLFLTGCSADSFPQKTDIYFQNSSSSQTSYHNKTMLNKKILFVAVPNFRDQELLIPKNILSQEGAEITIASFKKGDFLGNEGTTITADYEITEVDPKNFDAIVFIGGPGMVRELENKDLQELARKFYENGKITSAICIAPGVLAKAGILKNKKATSFPTARGYLIESGADYTASSVEVDGKIITADGPESATAFANELIKILK